MPTNTGMDSLTKSCLIVTSAMNITYNEVKKFIAREKGICCNVMSQLLFDYFKSCSKKKLFDNDLSGNMVLWREIKLEGGDNIQMHFEKMLLNNDSICELVADVVQCSIHIGYENQFAYCARPLLIKPTRNMMDCFDFMMAVEVELIDTLKAGMQLSKVYSIVKSFAEEKDPEKAKYLSENFGFALGFDDIAGSINISPNAEEIVQENAIFAVRIELIGLKEDGSKYKLYNGDTVKINKDRGAQVLTLYHNKYQKYIMQENEISN